MLLCSGENVWFASSHDGITLVFEYVIVWNCNQSKFSFLNFRDVNVVHHPDDISAANMLAVLLELCNLNRTAVSILENSLQKATCQESDILNSNLGRQLRKLGRYDKAIGCFKQIKEIDFTAQCEFALTLFLGKNSDLQRKNRRCVFDASWESNVRVFFRRAVRRGA